MLREEYRMPSHRRLLANIFRERRRYSGCNEINGVGSDGIDALVLDGLPILWQNNGWKNDLKLCIAQIFY
jgi:hypothetical protein